MSEQAAYSERRRWILEDIAKSRISEIPDVLEWKKARDVRQGMRTLTHGDREEEAGTVRALTEFWATWRYTQKRTWPGDPEPDRQFLEAMHRAGFAGAARMPSGWNA